MNRITAISAAAAIFTMPATAKSARSTSGIDRSTVPTSTAVCNAIVAASQTTSATALHAAMREAGALDALSDRAEPRRERANQQRKEQHAAERHRLRVMVNPWMMIDR